MRIGRSKLAGLLVVSAVLVTLTLPGAIVLAHDGGHGHDASAEGHHDAGGGHGDAASGGSKEALAGTNNNGTDNNGDIMGDARSNMHTGRFGAGAAAPGGDDKITTAAHRGASVTRSTEVHVVTAAVTHRPAEVTVVTPVVAPTHAAVVVESAREAAEARPGGAAAGAIESGRAPAATAVSAPSGAVLGAEQTARAPSIGAPRLVLGAQQTRPRTLPFTGLSAAWAMLMTGGRWAGVLFSALGLLLLARGLKRS